MSDAPKDWFWVLFAMLCMIGAQVTTGFESEGYSAMCILSWAIVGLGMIREHVDRRSRR